ncbi:hypothetical protein FSP39_010348 [Pinctada imbricata]|uniref:Fibrocystin-L n=1 Tax=Pinctada imbricata TaxID=66713 RepID=A0AA89CAR5_PINIB|nr:hypothetical protein FSP39_010348 [Pinctada imbricata]
MLYETWGSTSKAFSTVDDILTLSSSASDYSSKFIDEISFSDPDTTSNYVIRISGYFVPQITGTYRFYIKCDDYAALYFSSADRDPSSKTRIAECSTTRATYFEDSEQHSSTFSLVKGKSYYIQVLHGNSASGTYVHVGARMDTSPVLGSMTGAARQEQQVISISSPVVSETQVTHTQLSNSHSTQSSSFTQEVQKVKVSNIGANIQTTYRLTSLGATTAAIKANSDGPTVQKALNLLPMFSPDKVSITETSTADSKEFTITFNLAIGDLDPIVATVDQSGSSLQVVVSSDTNGVAGKGSMFLDMAGVISPPITPDASASDVETKLQQLFGVRCPTTFTASDNKYFEDFENPSSVSSMGEAVSDTEPFCGRYSIKNPSHIYKAASNKLGITSSQYPWLCFAYKGPLDPKIEVKYKYTESSQKKDATSDFTLSASATKDKWNYKCIDLNSAQTAAKTSGSNFETREITVNKDSTSSDDLYIDSVIITREDLATDTQDGILGQRILAAKPGGNPMSSVTVTKSSSVYTVTMAPHDCGNQFPMFKLAGSQTSTNLVTASSVTTSLTASSGSVSMATARTASASPPVTGTVDVTFEGHTVTVKATDNDQGVQDTLSTITGIGSLNVTRAGDCANFNWTINWLTRTGDLQEATVDGSNLQGNSPQASKKTTRNGGLWFDPILGDTLRTEETTPGVMAYINGIPTRCTGTCNFEWQTAQTPTITSVTPSSGASGTALTIAGTGFSTTPADNSVTIGGVACTVTTATATQIVCTAGEGSGSHDVKVNVTPKGLASGTVTYQYTSGVSSVTPSSGGLGGGTKITVAGSGFATTATVSVGTGSCVIESQTYSQIVCVTPAASAGTVDVSVNQYSTQLTKSAGFTYDNSVTASISSASRSTASVSGGETLTLTGTSFGTQSTDTKLEIGTQAATITSYTDTQVVATLPSQATGTYPVKLTVGAAGYALYSGSGNLEIEYKLKVTNMYPRSGSLYGGTVLTVIGEGFGTTASVLSPTVGSHACDIIGTVTDTQFTCQIAETGATKKITNQGSSGSHGVGYAWDPPYVQIEVGDSVEWTWYTSQQLTGIIKYGVHQTADFTSTTTAGFTSGTTQVSSGKYSYQFTSTGKHYYWSGYVDGANLIALRGMVDVSERAQSVEDFGLKRDGFEATYDTSASAPSSSGCDASTSISGCTTAAATGGTSGKFHFSFETCKSGSISAISLNQGHSQQDIVFTGEGFADSSCKSSNEITAGGYSCVVSASTATSATCRFATSASNPMPIAVMNRFMVNVKNRGYSILAIDGETKRSFVLEPHISSYSPQSGSTKGGFPLTIQGGGFTTNTAITTGAACTVDQSTITYDTITCTAASSNKAEDLEVIVTNNGNNLMAKCSDPSTYSCTIGYSSLYTPMVTAVSPASVSGTSSSLTITGSNFGTDASKVTVSVGAESCSVTSVIATQIECSVGAVPVGIQNVGVTVLPHGKASSTATVTSTATAVTVSPSSGSTNGGTKVTITGNGFIDGQTTVTFGGNACTVTSVTLSQIECTTPAGSGSATVQVTSNSINYPTATFTYDASKTPTISAVTPTSGNTGDSVTISGTSFSATTGDITVLMGTTACAVQTASTTQITCTLGANAAATVDVEVTVSPYGVAGTGTTFNYDLELASANPDKGSLGGGQLLTLQGRGFSTTSDVTLCGNAATVDASSTETQLIVRTPAGAAGACDVSVAQGGQTGSLPGAFTYDATLTPTISGVSPKHGGTGGGTTLTITGSGFGTATGAVSVMIGGVACAVQTVTATEVTCTTGARAAGSIDTQVELQISNNGIADTTNAAFSYYNVWSSTYSWGGGNPPGAGELVVIPQGMTILLDQDTPVLEMLLIQGGKVIFDEKDVTLNANYILITDNGALQVGTEEEPFQHKATIQMHGMFRSPELPIYGSKVLAVRNGTLDLHGRPTPVTWGLLASTANAGDTSITLKKSVNWEVGDKIVLPTTGHRHSQSQSETRTITAISADGKTLTLNSALTYSHVSITETYGSHTVEMAGEVGLLSHNVVFRGGSDPQWNDSIPACEDGFDTGEFTTQTCFQGRFGEEMGSDQFGAHILLHAPEPNTEAVIGRFEYAEFTHVGQAFRLGRYPIHFHLNGLMPSSYVRGCAIHNSFNRAVNIHGVHNMTIEHTVLYNIMGGSFFLEDGIETNNVMQYNLATFVKASSSLLNDDITPAAYWITNPNNIIQHNHAAGGTHFGFWYRMHEHPDGPSFDEDICPQNVPLGVYKNNTVHSQGWFGLWIFQEYHPHKDGKCDSDEHETAVFESLTVWNCEKGAEAVNVGATQYKDFIMVNNEKAGYEGKLIKASPQYDENKSYGVFDSVVVAKSPGLAADPGNVATCTIGGVILPYGNGMVTKGVEFYNFDETDCSALTFTKIDGTCSLYCGGYSYQFKDMSFTDSPNRGKFDWKWQGVLIDMDGTLTGTGTAGVQVVASNDNLPSSLCASNTDFDAGSLSTGVSLCQPGLKFHRWAVNSINPPALEAKNLIAKNSHGTDVAPFAEKRITHSNGWVINLIDGETYNVTWENAERVTNISYDSTAYSFDTADYVFINHVMKQEPDQFYPNGEDQPRNKSDNALTYANNKNGDWWYDDSLDSISFMVSGKKSRRRKRGSGAMPVYDEDIGLAMQAFKCYYTGCVPPPDPDTIPPTCTRPTDFKLWSAQATWSTAETGWGGNKGGGNYGLPEQGDQVKILKDDWVILDVNPPSLDKLVLEGTLELKNEASSDFTISVTYLYILGGRLIIGCDESTPFLGTASIVLRGDWSTPEYPITEGPAVGSKAIGVFGGLDLHGKDVAVTWTTLENTANAGDSQIVLHEQVSWSAGDEIIITATGYKAWEVEVLAISSIAADKKTITLNSTLQNKHIVHTETFATSGKTVRMAAEVGLLTRNIRIIGEYYNKMFDESYGARVLVGVTADTTRRYTGYARLSNVEFYRGAQNGFNSFYDPRHTLTYLDIPDTNVKPRYVKKCSFNYNFGTAIGVYGTDNLIVEDNVIYHSVGAALQTTSAGAKLRRNLFSLMNWPGSYQDQYETMNFDWTGLVDTRYTTGTVLEGNSFSSSERCGYNGHLEDSSDASQAWTENIFHTNLVGLGIMAEDLPKMKPAPANWRWSNVLAWKNWDFGVYYQHQNSFTLVNYTSIDNGVGVFSLVIGPDPVSHEYDASKQVDIEDSYFIGTSGAFDCSVDAVDANDDNIKLSSTGRSWRVKDKGRIAISFGNFALGPNGCPFHPLANSMSYLSIAGRTNIKDCAFAKFQTGTGTHCGQDTMMSTLFSNDDGIHPTRTSGLTLESTVDEDNKVYFNRPRVEKINPSDCVDMDCDGHKKVMVKDLDGTLLGSIGTVLPQSEWEWGGDPRRGLGDYRIPKALLTDTNGGRIDANVLAPNKGVLRDNTCSYKSAWQAYKCHGFDYKMIMIESMDADTELSRLSPVALLGNDDNDNYYLDLINGPQDHGWCAGYTCQKRLSLFPALVALNRNYTMVFTRNAPQNLRYLLLNSAKTDKVIMSSYHGKPNRLDVYADNTYVVPENGVLDSNDNLQLSQPTFAGQYFPDLTTAACGANYMDREKSLLHIVVCGGTETEIRTSAQIVIGFGVPSMTVDQFFGPNLVNNLATLLGISADKIRVMNVVTSTSSASGRRKRQASGDTTTYYIEVGNAPCSTLNCSTAVSTLTYTDQQNIAVQIINEYQTGNLSDLLNITINGMSVAEALPSSADPTWAAVLNATDYTKVVLIPNSMVFEAEATMGYEGSPFTVQPKLKMLDQNGDHVTVLGAAAAPWEVRVTLRSGSGSNPAATLVGNTTVTFVDGYANFTDLGISHAGSGYILDFEITYPTEAIFNRSSSALTIQQRPLKTTVVTASETVYQGGQHQITLDIRDDITDDIVADIAWSGLQWYANVSMVSGTTYTGSFTGTTVVVFSPVTGQVVFSDIAMDTVGMAHLQFHVYSVPSQYSLQVQKEISLFDSGYQTITEDTSQRISMKFDVDYATYGTTQFGAMVVNHFQPLYPYTRLSDLTVSEGSVVVTVTVNGNSSTVANLIEGFCDSITAGTSFSYGGHTFTMSTFLTVDNQTYYGVSCGNDVSADTTSSSSDIVLIIVLVVIAVLLVTLAIIAVLVWRLKVYPRTKTHRLYNINGNLKRCISVRSSDSKGLRDDVRYIGKGKGAFFFEDSFYRQDTFSSLRSEKSFLESCQAPPITTKFSQSKKQEALSGHF